MSIAPEAARLSTLLLRQLADLVAGLNEHQVGELLAGRTRLTLTAAQDGRAARPAPQAKAALPAAVDVEVLRTALLGATSREEAAERLAALGRVSVPQLRALAGALGVDGGAVRTRRRASSARLLMGPSASGSARRRC